MSEHQGGADTDGEGTTGIVDEKPGAPASPGGAASGLQPGGTIPGGSPGTSVGSLGTGGGSSGGTATGSQKKAGYRALDG